jgi:hypothetical protein
MKSRDTLITLAALVAVAIASWAAYRYETRPALEFCQVCGRKVHAGTTYRLDTQRGTERACCPRCGMHEQVSRPGLVKRAWATDFDSREMIPADAAYYVEGSDTGYCTMADMPQPVQRQPQGVSVITDDRCLPALVAFKTRSAAEAFQARHSGRILDYSQALESVRER